MPQDRSSLQSVMHRFRAVHWSGLRVLALMLAVLGAWGVFDGIPGLFRAASPMMRRLEPTQTLEGLLRDYPSNFATFVVFSLFMIVLSIHFFALLRDLYPHAPVAALVAGLLLGGSVLFGLILMLTALKVNEFALQAADGSAQQQPWFSAEQQAWLRGGINFLNQLHLIFVWGWLFCLGVGWMAVGSGVLGARVPARLVRLSGGLALVAGVGIVVGVLFELWEPTYAGNLPRFAVFFIRQWEVAIAAGFLASGVLGWSLADKTAPSTATNPSAAA